MFCFLQFFAWYPIGYFTLGDTLLMSCFFNVNSDPPLKCTWQKAHVSHTRPQFAECCCVQCAAYMQPFISKNFAKCCKHAAQCAVFYQQLKTCKMLKMLPQQPVISSQCKNMQSWPICCILHRPIEWISVHNLKMWFDKAKDHVHTIPRAQDNTL